VLLSGVGVWLELVLAKGSHLGDPGDAVPVAGLDPTEIGGWLMSVDEVLKSPLGSMDSSPYTGGV
jgi:hypothetical protein